MPVRCRALGRLRPCLLPCLSPLRRRSASCCWPACSLERSFPSDDLEGHQLLASAFSFDAEEASDKCRTLPRNCWAVATRRLARHPRLESVRRGELLCEEPTRATILATQLATQLCNAACDAACEELTGQMPERPRTIAERCRGTAGQLRRRSARCPRFLEPVRGASCFARSRPGRQNWQRSLQRSLQRSFCEELTGQMPKRPRTNAERCRGTDGQLRHRFARCHRLAPETHLRAARELANHTATQILDE